MLTKLTLAAIWLALLGLLAASEAAHRRTGAMLADVLWAVGTVRVGARLPDVRQRLAARGFEAGWRSGEADPIPFTKRYRQLVFDRIVRVTLAADGDTVTRVEVGAGDIKNGVRDPERLRPAP